MDKVITTLQESITTATELRNLLALTIGGNFRLYQLLVQAIDIFI